MQIIQKQGLFTYVNKVYSSIYHQKRTIFTIVNY